MILFQQEWRGREGRHWMDGKRSERIGQLNEGEEGFKGRGDV